MEEDDDARHRREEQERRAKRKASKISKSEAQLEKERKQKEHRQKILKQHGGGSSKVAGSSSGTASSRPTPPSSSSKLAELTKSAFQELFSQRAQGFQIDFRFRNAPPRPPVGPTFVGPSLDNVLQDLCQQYKPRNAVEVMYKWKLHSEPDLGVPLAPSAMDLKSYSVTDRLETTGDSKLHQDDKALLDWTGSLGDTAADKLKAEQERKRIKDRLMLAGKKLPQRSRAQDAQRPTKKGFSRVLNEEMQTWMKKTTYLSNDYTRKVHDFKSLADQKKEMALDLKSKQEEISKRRSATSISQGFAELDASTLRHPVRKDLKPKAVFQVLPDVEHWGLSITHVTLDKVPGLQPSQLEIMNQAYVSNFQRADEKIRMSGQIFLPSNKDDADGSTTEDGIRHDAVYSYDLDVVGLKEEDSPHTNFILSIDRTGKVARYLPISSRVQLSRGRPVRAPGGYGFFAKRPMTQEEIAEQEERAAEVDLKLAEKYGVRVGGGRPSRKRSKSASANDEEEVGFMGKKGSNAPEDDGEGDFGDDDDDESSDSGDEALFGTGSKTIVAEG